MDFWEPTVNVGVVLVTAVTLIGISYALVTYTHRFRFARNVSREAIQLTDNELHCRMCFHIRRAHTEYRALPDDLTTLQHLRGRGRYRMHRTQARAYGQEAIKRVERMPAAELHTTVLQLPTALIQVMKA